MVVNTTQQDRPKASLTSNTCTFTYLLNQERCKETDMFFFSILSSYHRLFLLLHFTSLETPFSSLLFKKNFHSASTNAPLCEMKISVWGVSVQPYASKERTWKTLYVQLYISERFDRDWMGCMLQVGVILPLGVPETHPDDNVSRR